MYSDNTLSDIKKYIYDNNAKMLFGKAVYYYIKNNNIVYEKKLNPQNPTIFNNKDNKKKLLKNYIYFQDYILGAATVCEKELLLLYLNKIRDKIIYLEDLSYLYMLVDGVEISYFDSYIIWYECSTGISNNINLGYTLKNKKDIMTCNREIAKNSDFCKKYAKYYFDERYINNIIFKIKRKLYNKYYKIKNSIFDKSYKNIEINNYNEITRL